MVRDILLTIAGMPARGWQYGQRCPYEAIVYGLTLAAIALVSKFALALLACVVVASGLFKIFR